MTHIIVLDIVLLNTFVVVATRAARVDTAKQATIVASVVVVVALEEGGDASTARGARARQSAITAGHLALGRKTLGTRHLREGGAVVEIGIRVAVEVGVRLVVAHDVVVEQVLAFVVLVVVVGRGVAPPPRAHVLLVVAYFVVAKV